MRNDWKTVNFNLGTMQDLTTKPKPMPEPGLGCSRNQEKRFAFALLYFGFRVAECGFLDSRWLWKKHRRLRLRSWLGLCFFKKRSKTNATHCRSEALLHSDIWHGKNLSAREPLSQGNEFSLLLTFYSKNEKYVNFFITLEFREENYGV